MCDSNACEKHRSWTHIPCVCGCVCLLQSGRQLIFHSATSLVVFAVSAAVNTVQREKHWSAETTTIFHFFHLLLSLGLSPVDIHIVVLQERPKDHLGNNEGLNNFHANLYVIFSYIQLIIWKRWPDGAVGGNSHGVIEIIIEQLFFDCLLSKCNFGKHVCTENKVIFFLHWSFLLNRWIDSVCLMDTVQLHFVCNESCHKNTSCHLDIFP